MGGLASGEWMPTTFVAVAPDAAFLGNLSILIATGMRRREQGDREGWVGWHLGSGCRQLLSQLLRTQLFLSIFQLWRPLGWEGEGRGRGKDGWVGIWGVDADNFCRSCCADAAVLVYLSILDAPGMGGGGQGDREGWVDWDLGSGCRQLLEQLFRTQLFSSIFQFWRPLGMAGRGGWVG